MLTAQNVVPKSPVTTISGRIFCDDTNGPARFATVTLQPANAVDALRSQQETKESIHSESVQTLLDGSFLINDVKAGTYYVIATAPGYVSPLNALLAQNGNQPPSDEARRKLAALAPRVTVQANLPASVNITLERGAAVSGSVLYDDGSPAAGVRVQLLVRRDGKWVAAPRMAFQSAIGDTATDDRGSYRISGLPPQQYAAEITLNLQKWMYSSDQNGNTSGTSSSVYSLSIYSGNKMRMKDADGFSLTQGEERGGEDMEIPVSRLHTVRGVVTAAHDGHLINGGTVELLYPDDKSQLEGTQITSDADFSFSFVPEGDYILRVTGATDTEYKEVSNGPGGMPPTHTERYPLRRYGDAEIPIHITGDMSGLTIAVPELKTATGQ